MSLDPLKTEDLPPLTTLPNLTRAAVGVSLALALLTVVGIVVYGGLGFRDTAPLAALPWVLPTAQSFMILSAFAIALLCFGRYRALGGAWVFWVGTAFLANAVLGIFYLLSWPGLVGDRGVIAQLPNTASWLFMLLYSGIALLLVAVQARRPQGMKQSYFLAAYALVVVFTTLIGLLSVAFESALPTMVTDLVFTPLSQYWTALLVMITAVAATSALRRYSTEHTVILGYIGLFLILIAFGLLDTIIGGKRYDLWWYASRCYLVAAYVVVLFGFLQEGYQLFGHERVRAEERGRLAEQLAYERARWQAVVESMLDPVTVCDAGGHVTYINPAYAQRVGYQVDPELPLEEHTTYFQLHRPDGTVFSPKELPLQKAALTGEEVREVEIMQRTDDGQQFIALFNASPLRDTEGQLIGAVAVGRDITAQRQAEDARERMVSRLQRQATQLNTIIDSIADAVLVYDREGNITLINDAGLALIGKERGEPLGNITDYAGALTLRYPDGRLLPIADLSISRALDRGETETGREELGNHPKTQQRIFLLVSAAPLRDDHGQIVGAVQVAADVTRLRELQERQDEFVALITHDLRSPLTSIVGITQLAQQRLAKLELAQEARYLEAVIKSAHRMEGMIQDLVESVRLEARQQAMTKEPVDFIRFVSDLVGRVGTPEDRLRLRVETPESMPLVLVDAAQVERALTNMLTNALKYSPPDKPVLVRVAAREGQVVFSVTDQGVGIPAEDLPHVFERHFRAKTAGKQEGLGLGLYITRLIGEAHGGHVYADSVVGEGSTFYFTLQLA